MSEIQWDHNSQYNNPHANCWYSQPVVVIEDDIKTEISFYVSQMRLIADIRDYLDGVFTGARLINLGEFAETIDNSVVVDYIKKYADFVLEGFKITHNFGHCPGFEIFEHD